MQASGHAGGETYDFKFLGSASALGLSVSWKESLPVSHPTSPVKGHDLPALRLVSLCGLGTPMERCYAGFSENRTNRMCII